MTSSLVVLPANPRISIFKRLSGFHSTGLTANPRLSFFKRTSGSRSVNGALVPSQRRKSVFQRISLGQKENFSSRSSQVSSSTGRSVFVLLVWQPKNSSSQIRISNPQVSDRGFWSKSAGQNQPKYCCFLFKLLLPKVFISQPP